MALIGQRGIGRIAPQRSASDHLDADERRYKITASLSHGQMTTGAMPVATNSASNYPGSGARIGKKCGTVSTFDQISVATAKLAER
jgi:hypothetical protein